MNGTPYLFLCDKLTFAWRWTNGHIYSDNRTYDDELAFPYLMLSTQRKSLFHRILEASGF